MFNKICLVFFCLGLMLACNRKGLQDCRKDKKVNYSNQSNIPELPLFITKMSLSDTNVSPIPILFQYKKTACFGYCPVYEFTLYTNGVCCYNGLHFVKQQGKTYGLFKEETWKAILKVADKIQFYTLESKYPMDEKMQIPDLPLTIITINQTGKSKTITDSHSAPKDLKDFELMLEEEINNFIEGHLK